MKLLDKKPEMPYIRVLRHDHDIFRTKENTESMLKAEPEYIRNLRELKDRVKTIANL